jgi:hypothetical protein
LTDSDSSCGRCDGRIFKRPKGACFKISRSRWTLVEKRYWLPRKEVLAWLTENHTGRIFAFWCWIKQAHPEIMFDRAATLYARLSIEEAQQPPQTDTTPENDGGATSAVSNSRTRLSS